jgi:ferredoxin
MKDAKTDDLFLEKYIAKYDEWLSKRKISFSAKVIPVSESLEMKQWVLPTEQAMEILRNAKSVAVQDCVCRRHYRRCDKPLEVCLLLNEAGEKSISKGQARQVSLTQAENILRQANERGLVHLTLYMPDHQVFALCSCCSCCCHDFQSVRLFDRKDLLVRSEYVAATDAEICINCGECIERCMFGARIFRDGNMEYHPGACLGCGLCVTVCPVEATSMQPRNHGRTTASSRTSSHWGNLK